MLHYQSLYLRQPIRPSPLTHSTISVKPFDYLRQPIRLSPYASTHSTTSVSPSTHSTMLVDPIVELFLTHSFGSYNHNCDPFSFFSSGVYSERIFWHASINLRIWSVKISFYLLYHIKIIFCSICYSLIRYAFVVLYYRGETLHILTFDIFRFLDNHWADLKKT